MTQPSTTMLQPPSEALAALLDELRAVETEAVELGRAAGRVLAQDVRSDRPSPPCDVSAMDGYAVRLGDLQAGKLLISAEAAIGQAPPAMTPGAAVRIFTGAAVPSDAEAVIKREDVREERHAIHVPSDLAVKPGANIRRCGENLAAGKRAVGRGTPIGAAVAAALATFGIARPRVYRRVRIAVLVTGNELLGADATPSAWQLRDANGPALSAMFGPLLWARLQPPLHVIDDRGMLEVALQGALLRADAVLLTGGVSMGDYDYVPEAIEAVGGRIVFHKLAQRPGKPMLGAVGPRGQAILGLPGNPVSVLATARRLALPALRQRAGLAKPDAPVPTVTLTNPGDKRLGLWWYRPVRLIDAGRAELVQTQGSGDMVATAGSDGFVELPPDAGGEGPWPFYAWSAT